MSHSVTKRDTPLEPLVDWLENLYLSRLMVMGRPPTPIYSYNSFLPVPLRVVSSRRIAHLYPRLRSYEGQTVTRRGIPLQDISLWHDYCV